MSTGLAAPFAAAGVFWLVTSLVVAEELVHSPLLWGTALAYLAVAVTALTVATASRGLVLACLWALAVVLFAVYFSVTGVAEGVVVTAFASALVGSSCFAAWAALGTGFWLLRRHTHP